VCGQVPEHESFAAAERALNEFHGWDTPRGIRPMSPHERQQAQQLLKDRRAKVVEVGKQAINKQRQDVRQRGDALVTRYDAAERLLDGLDEDIEDGLVSVTDLEMALADAARLKRELGKNIDTHLAVVDEVSKDQDPEQIVRRMYKRFPALGSEGRVSPWFFDW